MELSDPNLIYNIDRAIREMGLVGKMVTIRCDQESALIALAEKLARNRKGGAASGIIVDVVPGYRPQAKGAVERQVPRSEDDPRCVSWTGPPLGWGSVCSPRWKRGDRHLPGL